MKRLLFVIALALSMIVCGNAGRHYVYHPQTHSKSYTPGIARDSHGKIKRSESAKKTFLKEHGYTRVPKGYEVDHRVPLWKGGSDSPSNMQLLTKEQHKQKTRQEAHERAKTKKK